MKRLLYADVGYECNIVDIRRTRINREKIGYIPPAQYGYYPTCCAVASRSVKPPCLTLRRRSSHGVTHTLATREVLPPAVPSGTPLLHLRPSRSQIRYRLSSPPLQLNLAQ